MEQPKIYRVSRGWKIFISVFTPLLIAGMGYLAFLPFMQKRAGDLPYVIFCVLLGGGFMLLFLYCLVAVWKSKIEVYSDKIRDVELFKTTELFIQDIDGFRLSYTQSTQILAILPKDPKAKKIQTALVLENQKDFLDWVDKNLKNLDYIEAQKEAGAMLKDIQFGATEAERKAKLKEARRWSKVVNNFALAIAFWLMLWPFPYKYAVFAALIIPLFGVYLVYRYNGLVKLDDRRDSPHPTVATAILLPSLALALRAVSDWNIQDWHAFWPPFLSVLALSALPVFILTNKNNLTRKIGAVMLIVLFCSVYAYGAVINLNGMLDRSAPVIHTAQIMHKSISTGKHTSYHFELSPWGPRSRVEEVTVGRSLYNKHQVGDTVTIFLKKGRIGISWFYIR